MFATLAESIYQSFPQEQNTESGDQSNENEKEDKVSVKSKPCPSEEDEETNKHGLAPMQVMELKSLFHLRCLGDYRPAMRKVAM